MLPAKLLTSLLFAASAVCAAQTVTQQSVEINPSPQDAAAIAAANKPKPLARGRMTGHVICNDTHQPARGAMVMLQPIPNEKKGAQEADTRAAGMLSGRVGLDGTYEINHVPAGEYGVIAFYPGYLSPLDDLVITDGNDKDVEKIMRDRMAAQGVVHVGTDGAAVGDVTIERGATVSGRVLYADGSPASQVNIDLESTSSTKAKPGEMSMNVGAMMRAMFTHQSNGTDDQGRFRVSGIHPGSYRIAAVEPFTLSDDMMNGGDGMMAAGMGMLGGVSDPKAQHVYAGDTIHRKAAKVYELRAGDTLADLDIRLPIDGYRTVRIKLAAADGRPINRATVTLQDTADDTLLFAASQRDDGLFEAKGIPPGTYTIQATKATIGLQFNPATAAFADGTSSIIVKETDGSEVALTLKEVPLPPPGKMGDPD